ncbi:hypothetical protein H2248_009836 [Termitomyces sp. 'cryptogamus']|nr:hypothetical protein H2248_009836 [Termitomyces sp. 'cryptogamus']
MGNDADVLSAIQAIKTASKKVKLTDELEESIEQLNSISKLLEIDAPSPAVFQRLSLLLRQTLLPVYNTFLILGIRYAVAILGTIFSSKVLFALKNHSTNSVASWEAVQASLLSGVLDYLESSSSYETRDIVANSFYPTLRDIFFPRANLTFRPGPDLTYILCQVLSETVTSHTDNQARLRNKDVLGGTDLGLLLSQSKNILVIEALLELIVKLLPSKRSNVATRTEFLQDVFDAANFACRDMILEIFETTPPTAHWDIIFIKIIDLLGNTDPSFPQSFKISNFRVQGSEKTYNIERLYVDHLGFVANIDEDDQIETLHALYASVQSLKVTALHNGKAAVIILFSPPPSVGHVAMTPSDGGANVIFDIETEDLARFFSSLKLRNVKSIDPPGRKFSKLEESLDLNFIPNSKNPVVLTQDKGRDFARLWDLSNSQPHAGSVLPTSPLMPRAISEVRDASTLISPTRTSDKGSATKTSSPYYDSIFGTTDEELTDPSDTVLNLTLRRSIRLSRGKQLRSGKPCPEAMESDNESQIIRKVKSRRKTVVLSDIETDRMKSPSQIVPEMANSTSKEAGTRLLSKRKAQSLADENLRDDKAADRDTGKAVQPVLKPSSAADSTHPHQPTSPPPANERPKPRRKRKSAMGDTLEIDGPDSGRPPAKRLRIRPETNKNLTGSKPLTKPAPVKRYGRKGRTSSPILPSGPEPDFEVVPVPPSKPEEKQGKVSTMKDKSGKTSTATTDKKKLKTTEKYTDVPTAAPSRGVRTKAKTEDKALSDDTQRPLLDKVATEGRDKRSNKSASERRSGRVAKALNVTDEDKMEQCNSVMPTVEPEENLQDECASEKQANLKKKPQRAPWEKIGFNKSLSTADTPETIIGSTREPPTVPTIVQDIVAQQTHVTVETPVSPTILREGGVQEENRDARKLDADSVRPKPISPKKSAEDESKLSKPEAHKVLIDLTKDSPLPKKVLTKNIVERKFKLEIESSMPLPPENVPICQPITSTITMPLSPESRPSLTKPDRPRVSFAPSASFVSHSTFDTTPELEFGTSESLHYPKKNENSPLIDKYRHLQPHGQKLFENDHVQPTKKYNADSIPQILNILDEINEVMKHKTLYRFDKVRQDLRTGQGAILRETAQHLEEIYVERYAYKETESLDVLEHL